MSVLSIWSFFLALGFASAQVCAPTSKDLGTTYFVRNQSDVDTIARECTEIKGGITISSTYTGSFYLPNVQTVTSSISWFREDWSHVNDTPALTTLDLPDLEFAGSGMHLFSLPTLKNLSAPRLRAVEWGVGLSYVDYVDLRSLESAKHLTISGDLSSVRLDSLRDVREELSICNKARCDRNLVPVTQLDLSLPALQTVDEIRLEGTISSLALPSLIEADSFSFRTGNGPAINLTFPRLNSSGYMSIDGNIASLSMPNWKNMTSSSLYLHTTNPLDINLPAQEVDYIDLTGNITSVQFPDLKSISKSLNVYSDLPIDCESIVETLSGAINGTEADNNNIKRVHCRAAEKKSRSGLATGAKIAIGVVVGVVGLGGIGLGMYFFRRRSLKR